MDTNQIIWQDHFDRQNGRGKYASPNNLQGNMPDGMGAYMGNMPTGEGAYQGNMPTVSPQQSSNDSWEGRTFRMPMPNWAPGEFEEWKTAKMTGGSTQYGRNAQRRYDTRKFPSMDSWEMNDGTSIYDASQTPTAVTALQELLKRKG